MAGSITNGLKQDYTVVLKRRAGAEFFSTRRRPSRALKTTQPIMPGASAWAGGCNIAPSVLRRRDGAAIIMVGRMRITLDLPEDIAQGLEAMWQDLPRVALESLALEAYRSRALTVSQLRRLLGFETAMQVDASLKLHEVY